MRASVKLLPVSAAVIALAATAAAGNAQQPPPTCFGQAPTIVGTGATTR